MNIDERLNQAIIDNPTVFTRWDGKPFERGKQTVSASELWQCARKMAFTRSDDHSEDPDWEQNYGFFERGHAVEDRMVQRLRQALPPGWSLLKAGDDQETLVYENVSATPDGLFCQTDPDIGGPMVLPGGQEIWGAAVLEIKSLDPRANMSEPKAQHVAQAKLQIELFRALKLAEPTGAVLLYVDASDYSKRQWHWVDRDPGFLEVAMARSQMVQDAKDPMELMAEGVYDGSCQYCSYKEACGEATLRYLPIGEKELDGQAAADMEKLLSNRSKIIKELDRLARDKGQVEEHIRHTLRYAGTNKARVNGTSISYTKRSGPRTLDVKSLKKALGDERLDNFYRTGRSSARLVIKESN